MNRTVARALATIGVGAALLGAASPALAAKPLKVRGGGVLYNGGGGGFGGFEQFAGTVRGTMGQASYHVEVTYACTMTGTTSCTHQFSATFATKNGTLSVVGPDLAGFSLDVDGPFTVVGGTGTYAGATGSGTAMSVFDPVSQHQTLTLTGTMVLLR